MITAATLRLHPAPPEPVTVLAAFESVGAAAEAVAQIMAAGIRPTLLELIDRPMLMAIDDWKHHGTPEPPEQVWAAADEVFTAASLSAAPSPANTASA